MTRCSHCLCNSISGSASTTVLSLDPFRSGSHNLVRSTTPETSVSRADTAVDPLGSGRLDRRASLTTCRTWVNVQFACETATKGFRFTLDQPLDFFIAIELHIVFVLFETLFVLVPLLTGAAHVVTSECSIRNLRSMLLYRSVLVNLTRFCVSDALLWVVSPHVTDRIAAR